MMVYTDHDKTVIIRETSSIREATHPYKFGNGSLIFIFDSRWYAINSILIGDYEKVYDSVNCKNIKINLNKPDVTKEDLSSI